MPLVAWLLFCTGPAIIVALRLATWIARATSSRANPRPGYLDLTQARRRARKEHA